MSLRKRIFYTIKHYKAPNETELTASQKKAFSILKKAKTLNEIKLEKAKQMIIKYDEKKQRKNNA